MACYIHIKADDQIAERLHLTGEDVTNLRGLYEEYNKVELDTSDINEASSRLDKFYGQLKRIETVNKYSSDMASGYVQMSSIWNRQKRTDRMNLVAALFSNAVDRIASANPTISREEIMNGWSDSNGYHGGQFSLFEEVYNRILNQCNNMMMREAFYRQKNDEINTGKYAYLATQYRQILDNWGPLVAYTRILLRDTEGVKMGKHLDYVADANISEMSDNDLTQLFDPEATIREGWQIITDYVSSFGSIGKEVRKAISNIPIVAKYVERINPNTGEKVLKPVYERDDLGNVRMYNPIKVHQTLLDAFRGMTSSRDMMNILRESGSPLMQTLYNVLINNPRLRTQFYVDFRKNFQPYTDVKVTKKRSGIISIVTRSLNKSFDKGIKSYKINTQLGKVLNRNHSIYTSAGGVDWNGVQYLRDILDDLFDTKYKVQKFGNRYHAIKDKPAKVAKFFDLNTDWSSIGNKMGLNLVGITRDTPSIVLNRAMILTSLCHTIGVDVSMDTIENIVAAKDKGKLNTLVNELRGLVSKIDEQHPVDENGNEYDPKSGGTAFASLMNSGIDAILSTSDIKLLEEGNGSKIKGFKTFTKFLTAKGNKQKKYDKNEGEIEGHIKAILNVLGLNSNNTVESRVTHKDRKGKSNVLYSDVTPSFLGDFTENIMAYAYSNNPEGLHKLLDDRYGTSSMFKLNGKWLNKWIEDLYNSDLGNEYSFARQFQVSRFLGSVDTEFENFTEKNDMLRQLHQFLFCGNMKDESGKHEYANYPIFVLGDSGVAKTIVAKRYSKDEIVDGMYNLYLSEIQRQKLITEANRQLEEDGYKPIDNIKKSHADTQFTLLPFLNRHYKDANGSEPYESIWEDEGITGIEDKVKAVIRAYMKDASETFYKRLASKGLMELTQEGKSIYFDTQTSNYAKESTTVEGRLKAMADDFFWNTKFAYLNQFQMMTIDVGFYKNTKDLQKRYKEIHAPGSVLDVNAINVSTGQPYCPEENGKHIERVIYFDDPQIDASETNPEFMTALESIFPGSKYDSLRKSYMRNALADGQGYRTIDSYRKVMGMAGKWTSRMEDTYNMIKALRANYGINPNFNKMSAGQRESYLRELKRIRQQAVVFMPIKPYMFTFERLNVNGDILNIPVQHKYAEAVIIPELMHDGLLKDMALYMEENNIDVAGSWSEGGDKIVKVGGYGSTSITNLESNDSEMLSSGMSKDDIDNTSRLRFTLSKAKVHELPYEDYRIQTNVPEHLNQSQLFGTQLRKLIMSHLNMKDNHYSKYVGGRKVMLTKATGYVNLNGRNLLNFYNGIICANIFDDFDQFKRVAESPKELSKVLQQMTSNNSRESLDNLLAFALDENGNFEIPLFEGSLEHDSAAFLLSMFKKMVNKQKMKGGSAVQVSAMGITDYEVDGGLDYVCADDEGNVIRASDYDLSTEEGQSQWKEAQKRITNVLYAECEVPFDLSVTVGNHEVALEFEDWCNPDGTLKANPRLQEITDMVNAYNNIIAQAESHFYSKDKYKERKGSTKVSKDEVIDFLEDIGRTDEARRLSRGNINIDYTLAGVEDKITDYKKAALNGDNIDELLAERKELEKAPTLIESVYPHILDRVAYRIPTERDYSMLNLKIVRFSQKTNGGTIRVPSQGTTIAGFDFDIDKLYFLMHESRIRELNNTDKSNIWKIIYRENRNIYKALKDAQARKALREGDVENILDDFLGKLTKHGGQVIQDIIDARQGSKQRLYNLWSEAGLEGTPEEFFLDTLLKHATEYLDEYNFDIPIKDNSRSSRNNMLLELIRQRLMDRETAPERLTPGGFNVHRKAARILRELRFDALSDITNASGAIDFNKIEARIRNKNIEDPEPSYDPSDPYTNVIYNQQNQVAGKLIGIFANQSTNYAFASLMSEFRLSNPIEFCGHKYYDLLNPPEGSDVALHVVETLAASVDAVKDPVLNFLNYNTITANSAALLLRIGYTPLEVGLLFNQPIISDACEKAFDDGQNINQALDRIKDIYEGRIQGSNKEASETPNLTREGLALNIARNRSDYKMSDVELRDQLAIAELFRQILSTAQELSDFVMSTKFTAANSIGSTFGDLLQQQEKVQKYIGSIGNGSNITMKLIPSGINVIGNDSPIRNGEELLDEDFDTYMNDISIGGIGNPFAFEQAMFDMNRKAIKILMKYYPYDKPVFKGARNVLGNLVRYGSLDADEINNIHSDLLQFLLAQQRGTMFDAYSVSFKPTADDPEGGDEQFNIDFFRNEFPSLVISLMARHPELRTQYPIFQYMIPETADFYDKDNNTGAKKIILTLTDVGGLSSQVKDDIRASWEQLYRDGESNTGESWKKDLAENLFYYNYYRIGFGFSPLAFMHLCPTFIKEHIKVTQDVSYKDFLENILKGQTASGNNDALLEEFAIQFILNHADDKKFVYSPNPEYKDGKLLRSKAYSNNVANKEITLDVSEVRNSKSILRSADDERSVYTFVPAINIDGMIYIAQSGQGHFNEVTGKDSITYICMSPLGAKNKSKMYYSNSSLQEYQNFQEQLEQQNSEEDLQSDNALEGSTGQEEVTDGHYNRQNALKALTDFSNKMRGFLRKTIKEENYSQEEISRFNQLIKFYDDLAAGLTFYPEQYSDQTLTDSVDGLLKDPNIADADKKELKDTCGNKIC